MRLHGVANQTAEFLVKYQLSDAVLWAKFVDQFRIQQDSDNQGWRGEYWGKMMRGGVLVYQYCQSDALYQILEATVRDLLTVAEADGRVSSYKKEKDFTDWDLWCRKYVLLGLEYFLEICRDEALQEQILSFLTRAADDILAHIGEGKIKITKASGNWMGANSSSILEPMVKLYRLTKEQKYLDFARHIIDCGAAEGTDLFEAAYKNELLPYQYGVPKAYEVMSCFEGLLEYYYATGIEKYKTAVINFSKGILSSEISIIGCSGITHELFDHTKNRQTVPYDIIQETCVTVTWMKFCSRLLELTGESIYADAMEQSFYNAYLGAVNTELAESGYMQQKIEQRNIDVQLVSSFLAFDSYSPLIPLKRGRKVGGNQFLSDGSYYGCCARIGAAGLGVFIKNMLVIQEDTVTLNFFEQGEFCFSIRGQEVCLSVETDYPVNGAIRIKIDCAAPTFFRLKIRNPAYAEGASGYRCYEKEWQSDTIAFEIPMEIKQHFPIRWEEDVIYTDMSKKIMGYSSAAAEKVVHHPKDDHYVALTRGPIVLAADSRCGKSADSIFDFEPIAKPCKNEIIAGIPCLMKFEFTDRQGEKFQLIDYASAGKDWDTLIAAWLPTK